MKLKTFAMIILLLFTASVMNATAGTSEKKNDKVIEANVWIAKDGEKRFVCPVMGGEGVVDENTTFSIVDGKKYYHCCGGCSGKLTENPEKYLKDFAVPGNVVKIDSSGQHFKCPISGEMGLVDSKTKFVDADGKRYYLCCNSCKTKFEANPEKFTQAKPMKHDHKHDHQHNNH